MGVDGSGKVVCGLFQSGFAGVVGYGSGVMCGRESFNTQGLVLDDSREVFVLGEGDPSS